MVWTGYIESKVYHNTVSPPCKAKARTNMRRRIISRMFSGHTGFLFFRCAKQSDKVSTGRRTAYAWSQSEEFDNCRSMEKKTPGQLCRFPGVCWGRRMCYDDRRIRYKSAGGKARARFLTVCPWYHHIGVLGILPSLCRKQTWNVGCSGSGGFFCPG